MRKIVADSSNLKTIGYSEGEQLLEIEFQGSGAYHYFDVPPAEVARLVFAESQGRHFCQHIRGKYRFEKAAVARPTADTADVHAESGLLMARPEIVETLRGRLEEALAEAFGAIQRGVHGTPLPPAVGVRESWERMKRRETWPSAE